MSDTAPDFDLLVIGSGLIGAIVARQFLDARPEASVAMVEAGGSLGQRAGEHLIGAGTDALDATYHRLMRQAHQVAGDRRSPAAGALTATTWSPRETGMIPAQFLGHDMSEFPGAALAWNIGGMGVHWTAACPSPSGPELIPGIPASQWSAHLAAAQHLLRVSTTGYTANPFTGRILAALAAALPSNDPTRAAQVMPMAGVSEPGGPPHRTGPIDILPELDQGHPQAITLLHRTLCTRILVTNDRAWGVTVRPMNHCTEHEITARIIVLAADALRTPQLLWASGIGGPAVGRYLNEHASLSTAVAVDHVKVGMPDHPPPTSSAGEPFVGAYWAPSDGPEQPIHTQLMETAGPDWHTLRITVYAPTQIRVDNQIEFSRTKRDRTGMPRMRVRFHYTNRDHDIIEAARRVHQRAAAAIGDNATDPGGVLPAGSSMHYTGTARMGSEDDGTSVCDTTGRVWGASNVFVAGNAVVPTSLSCNSTITSAALAVATGQAAAQL